MRTIVFLPFLLTINLNFGYGTSLSLTRDIDATQPTDPELPSASELLEKSISSLGGREALAKISGLTFHAPEIFRGQTLTQNYGMAHSDQFVAISGSQNVSFAYSTGHLQQRIDRTYQLSDYWIWALPNLNPSINFSLVTQDGPGPFACFIRGGNSLWFDTTQTLGYADAGLSNYLIHQAQKFNPLLLTYLQSMNSTTSSMVRMDPASSISLPAIHSSDLNLTVIFNETTSLPYIIRQNEYHAIFGQSTNDLFLTSYRPINIPGSNHSVVLPHRFQTIYNSGAVLQDYMVESVDINPDFPEDFFAGLPISSNSSFKATPMDIPGYGDAEIGEFYESALWAGVFPATLADLNATHPIPTLPQIWHLSFSVPGDFSAVGTTDYSQLVIELDDGVLVTDAPPHQSEIVIQWIHEKIKKPIKYIWPSHHHHDHSYGAAAFVHAGAIMVVPDVAREFWSNIPNITMVTFNEIHPFILRSSDVQVRILWRPEAPHAADWSYLIATHSCPGLQDEIVVFEADVWSPGTNGTRWDMGFARQWLDWISEDGLSRNAIVAASHGGTGMLETLIEETGYPYPSHGVMDWKAGGHLCP
ncbi:hypothetical protein F5884DRAFT_827055 [Xylogone sp. PMI_703]|nr:hypothetical protein F5884DRAFT_827055 [Xylogone sp. PMI_703]